MDSGQETKQRIRSKAAELGFSKTGFARADELQPEGAHLREWIHRGFHGTMTWMAAQPERRTDPRRVFADARTIICTATNYYAGNAASPAPGSARISRYAWGDDYHDVVKHRLEDLLAFVCEAIPGSRGVVYVDTGPVMEKAWAQRAGLGWIGKHTNLITEETGSWVFLGEILLDAELPPDTAGFDQCGNCMICIDACPTGALDEPYVLNANSCISYLTIEHRGELPAGLAQELEGWVFGCDICQDVCPWNVRNAVPTTDTSFHPRPSTLDVSLQDIADLGALDYQQRFRKSPVKRAKLSGLRRNALVQLKTNIH